MDYNKKKIYILGGGTFSHVRTHFSLAAPAFGKAAKQLKQLCDDRFLLKEKLIPWILLWIAVFITLSIA